MWGSFKLGLIYVTLGTLAGAIGIPYTILRGNIEALYLVGMWIAALGVRFAGVRVHVSGLETLPSGVSCIFMCNHVSNLDPPVVLPALPGRAVVLLKRSLMRIPLLGTAMRLGGYIPVDRGQSRDAAQRTVSAAVDAVRGGVHILVFPEGTRSTDGRLATFKKGPFFLAMATGAPVVPMVVSGTQRALPKGSVRIAGGDVALRFLPPLAPEQFTSRDELMRAVHAAMADALPEEMKPKGAIGTT